MPDVLRDETGVVIPCFSIRLEDLALIDDHIAFTRRAFEAFGCTTEVNVYGTNTEVKADLEGAGVAGLLRVYLNTQSPVTHQDWERVARHIEGMALTLHVSSPAIFYAGLNEEAKTRYLASITDPKAK